MRVARSVPPNEQLYTLYYNHKLMTVASKNSLSAVHSEVGWGQHLLAWRSGASQRWDDDGGDSSNGLLELDLSRH